MVQERVCRNRESRKKQVKINNRNNRMEDILINRMHEIKGRNVHNRKRKVLHRYNEYIRKLFHEKEVYVQCTKLWKDQKF